MIKVYTSFNRSLLQRAKQQMFSGTSVNVKFSGFGKVHPDKPIVVFLPFLGATSKAIEKYVDLYETYGCQVITHKTNIRDFIWPSSGMNNSLIFLKELENTLSSNSKVIVHSMSIGCYFYSLILMHLNEKPENFSNLKNSLKGQVIDSPVVGSLNHMATGIAISSFPNGPLQQRLLESFVLLYFLTTKPFTVKYYESAITTFREAPCHVPSILFTTENDPMALPSEFNSLVEDWKRLGIDVVDKIWTESKHASILRTHPEQYRKYIYSFLSKVFVTSKM